MKEITLECKRETYKLNLPGGTHRMVELREMTAAVRDKHMDGLRGRMDADNGIIKFDEMEADLLCRCLYDVASDKLIPLSEIQSWPASSVHFLYTEANEMHKIVPGGETPKNG